MLNYGVFLHIPGTVTIEEDEESGLILINKDSALRYTLHISGDNSDDFTVDSPISMEVNKSGSFEFSILPSHTYYSMLRRFIHYIEIKDLDDDEIIFYGRINSITMGFSKEKKVTVEGGMSNLLDCPVYNPDVESSTLDTTEIYVMEGTPDELFRKSIRAYRNLIRPDVTIGSVLSYASSFKIDKIDVSGGQTVGDFIMNELVGGAGGYIIPRYVKEEGGNISTVLDWLPDPLTPGYSDTISSQTIEFGVNLLDIDAEFSDDDVMTGIIPSWTDENNDKQWATAVTTDVDTSQKNMLKPYIVGGTGTTGIGIQMIDLPELTDQSEALTAAQKYAERYCNYNLSDLEFDSFKVKALDMHYFGESSKPKFKIGDRIKLISEYHNLDMDYPCTAMTLDLDNPSNNDYTFSVYRPKASSNDKTLCRQLNIKESEKRKVHKK